MALSECQQKALLEPLRSSPTFSDCEDELLIEMIRCGTCAEFQSGAAILNQDEPSIGMYWVESGIVRISRLNHNGREYILSFLPEKSTFNDVTILDQGCNPASVIAHTGCCIWSFPCASVLEIATRYPELVLALARNIATNTRFLVHELDGLSMYSVKARLARFLLAQANSHNQIQMQLTQEELASHLGTVREMVSRSLRKLKADGVIHMTPEAIVILDRNQLIAEAKL